MAVFYFSVVDNDGVLPADDAFDFPDVHAAVEQAKKVLAEMALDGLPTNPLNAIAVEVQNADHHAVARVALRLDVQLPVL